MRWVLPGGAQLGGGNNARDERRVVCRLGAAVEVRPRERDATTPRPPTLPKLPTPDPSSTAPRVNPPSAKDAQASDHSRLREIVDKVVLPILIAVLTAILLAWLGLSK